jgi:G3E family GTPase
MTTLDNHEEAVKQAAVADHIILTKCDLTDGNTDALERRLRTLNPGHRLAHAVHGVIDPAFLLDVGPFDPAAKNPDVTAWLRAEAYEGHSLHDDGHHDHGAHGHDHGHGHAHADVNRHDAHIRAFCFTHDRPVSEAKLRFFLQLLAMLRGPDLLRVKGIVHVAERPDQPAVIHGVQHLFHPLAWLTRWPGADRRSKLVFIVRDIAPRQIGELMASLFVAPEHERA